MKKAIRMISVALILVVSMTLLCGCKNLSEEEHLKRIAERIDELYFNADAKYPENGYTDYTVELLYNYKDEPVYFLVEFEPGGFLYGFIYNNKYYYTDTSWYANTLGTNTSYYNYRTKQYENKSHFYVAGITDEKKYLSLSIGEEIPAVKRGDVFIRIDLSEDEETDLRYQSYWDMVRHGADRL